MRAMPTVRSVLQRRRRRLINRRRLSRAARLGVVLMAMATIALGVAAAGVGRLYLELSGQVPAVEDIQAFFDEGEQAAFRPSEIVDREGRALFLLQHPAAAEAEWVGLREESPVRAPDHLVLAILMRQDQTFLQREGALPGGAWSRLLSDLLRLEGADWQPSIGEQLVEATLLPAEDYGPGSLRRDFRLLLLVERLAERYDKDQLLTWYLNSADFGHFNYGVDSAALAYFGKHADGLTLGESAVLAALPGQAERILASPTRVRQAQREVLAALVQSGEISERKAREARSQPLMIDWQDTRSQVERSAVGEYVLAELETRLGRGFRQRGGLTVVTTLDADLQRQASCVIATEMARLSGGDPTASLPAADGSPCLAAGLLPPLRPGLTGVDYGLTDGLAIVLDPAQGELLALAGSTRSLGAPDLLDERPLGEAVQPFLYLTAFSRGFSPGTMVLDLPLEDISDGGLTQGDLARFHGPVRMRTALVGGFRAAAARTVQLAGRENVLRTLREFNLLPRRGAPEVQKIAEGGMARSPIELVTAYGVVANRGLMVGSGNGRLEATTIREVTDRFGRPIYQYQPDTRVVLGDGLAYLLLDVLGQEAGNEGPFANAGSLLADRPSGLVTAEVEGSGDWAIGLTPRRVVGLWLGSPGGGAEEDLSPQDGALPILKAIMRYATRDLAPAAWEQPAQVVEVDVCDPSGLLPTEYCPRVVRELYLQGTEPSAFDSLYQPFAVNKETGKLATLETPLEDVEERVYLVPPPEAAAWAEKAGLERPPDEYDAVPAEGPASSQVRIASPSDFEIVAGEVALRGNAHPQLLASYRLQYGRGLNPRRWTQIGETRDRRVWDGVLGRWETADLSGLFTVQLLAVLEDGALLTDSVTLTVDNSAPDVELLAPVPGARLHEGEGKQLAVEVRAVDNVSIESVEVFLDGHRLATLENAPYLLRSALPSAGAHELYAVAIDAAGNETRTSALTFEVTP